MSDTSIFATQHRTNSQIGGLLVICGLLAACFGVFGLFVIGLQAAILQVVPAPTTAAERQFVGILSRMHVFMALFMPSLALVGVSMAISGWHVRRGSATAIRMARWTLLGGIAWSVAYCANIVGMLLDPAFGPRMMAMHPLLEQPLLEPYRPILYAVQGFFALGMLFGPPALLLFLLRRARPLDDKHAALATATH